MKSRLLILIASMSMFSPSCKKYPDGPTISIMPRRERIEGKWIASSVKFNNNDSTGLYSNYIWEFTRNYSVILQVNQTKKLGIWSTVTNDTEFRIDYDDGTVEHYQILKLKLKEFWLRNSKTQVEFHLQPK